MEITGKTLAKVPKSFTWLPVIFFIAAALGIRFWQNISGNYLLIGGDGPYYPLQVRSMYEHFKLALPDMPLLFVIEAFVAKLLYVCHYSSLNNCIIMAAQITDSILPPLAAIPVFLISKDLKPDTFKGQILNYLLVCFSVINLTTISIFSSGLQKNAFAVVWIFTYIFFFIRFVKREQKKDSYYLFFVLFFCILNHFGSFVILLFFSMISGIIWLFYNSSRIKEFKLKWFLLITCTLIMLVAILAFYDFDRLLRLLKIPFKILEYPVLLMMLHGDDIGLFLNPIHMIVANLLAIIASIILLMNRKKTGKDDKIISFALLVLTFFLSSPLVGIEWANRLYILSYVPLTVLYLFIFNKTGSGTPKIFPAVVFTLLIIFSILNIRSNNNAITNEAYEEFVKMGDNVDFSKKSIVIGRQDLRLLASWEFRTKSASDYLFTKDDFKNYDNVFVIRQIKGSNFSKNRFRGDASVPNNSILVYSGKCFELYKIKNNEAWEGGKGKPAGVIGKVILFNKSMMAVQNEKSGTIRIIELNKSSSINLKNKNSELKNGLCVEIYGQRKPLSLHFIAELISEIDCDK